MNKKIIEMVNKRLMGKEVFGTGANNHNLWLQMYRDESPWLSAITLSMGIPASIASELARLTTIEFMSEISNDEDLDKDYQKVVKEARTFTEHGLALGGIILKPYVSNDKILVDYITPDLFIPISFNDKTIEHIVFIDEYQDDEFIYRRLEEHDLTGKEYIVNNAVFRTKERTVLGDEVSLNIIEKWSFLEETVPMKNVDRP
ncbi:MAG TPA: hypothetical protein VK998_06985, partial [Schnuerera sp.]|nr:hypothetical protein [Schnuerera sp.]